MRQSVFVISDLHLGGAPPSDDDPGFQIFGEKSRKILVNFLSWIAKQRSGSRDVHLVINGDTVDFLAEEPFQTFTADQSQAVRKLATIMSRTCAVWEAFREVVRSGAEVTFLLGNHDLELALPKPRELLRRTLGPGRIDLLFDNSALQIGPDVLIEHGNRYDGWNAVKHDALRRIRSAVSRGEDAERFPDPPGSRLVIQVMNRLKKELRFIDLLKPETEGVFPLIAALRPLELRTLNEIRKYKKTAEGVRYMPDGSPEDHEMISSIADRERQLQRKTREFVEACGIDPDEMSTVGTAMGLLDRWLANVTNGETREAEVKIAYEALQCYFGAHFTAFDTQLEAPEYVRPLTAAVKRGFRTIIYGHTHLAKRMPLSGGGLYMNTGTWAELMAVPRGILLDEETMAKRELSAFLDDLSENKLDGWKTILPTFAKLELDGGSVTERELFVYRGEGDATPIPPGRLVPLSEEVRDDHRLV